MRYKTVEEALDDASIWANSVHLSMDNAAQQIKEAMHATSLPKGCPSHASMAAMMLSAPKQKIGEFAASLEELEKTIFAEGS